MPRLLVIDDEQAICWGLAQLGRRLGHEVQVASSAEQGLELASRTRPDLVLLDVRLPGMDGLAALSRLRELAPAAPVVVMTAHGDLGTAVEAVRHGASDYVAKPFDLAQIERIIERSLRQPKASAPASITPQTDGLVGRTSVMQEVFKRIALVAPSEACVLLAGESGTGKELVARAIHRYSRHASGPFVAVNVAALSPTLVESELFGHARGAFTGAEQPRPGLLTQANGGTLFLDEVAEIPAGVQVKLLRALEQGEVLPVGSERAAATSFRLISATHQDLPEKVRRGQFRHDLFYRLATFQIELPPLRTRPQDVPALVEFFLQEFAPAGGGRISQAALDELLVRPWHGNVRELRGAVQHALILARDGLILPEHLPSALTPVVAGSEGQAVDSMTEGPLAESLRQQVEAWAQERLRAGAGAGDLHSELLGLVEPPLLEAALRKNHHQVAAAARVLGMHRTTLKKKLDDYGIAGEDP